MKKRISLLIVLAMCTTILFGGCAKPKVKVEEDMAADMTKEVVKEEAVTSDDRSAPTESDLPPTRVPAVDELSRMANDTGMLTPVYFDFDQFNVRDDMKPGLNAVAKWLKRNGAVKVRIQGHCDERGSNEYNVALGERRATSVRNYLTTLGVSSSRVATVTYGEEKPTCTGHDEGCWWKNRRGEVEVTVR